MSNNPAIDLSQLPAPQVIEQIDYEQILAERKLYAISLWPVEQQANIAARLALESEPMTKLLQETAYRELILRQRINDAARANLVAFATDSDLEHLLALLQVKRLPGELDQAYRERALLSVFAFSTAGPHEAYRYHARSAHPDVLDAGTDRPTPGVVRVTVLSRVGNGVPSQDVLTAVTQKLNADDIRPLNDDVVIEPGQIVQYRIRAKLHFSPGAAPEPILAAANSAAARYTSEQHRLGAAVRLSGIYAALHQPGLLRVELLEPLADIEPQPRIAPWCAGLELGSVMHYG